MNTQTHEHTHAYTHNFSYLSKNLNDALNVLYELSINEENKQNRIYESIFIKSIVFQIFINHSTSHIILVFHANRSMPDFVRFPQASQFSIFSRLLLSKLKARNHKAFSK